MERIQPLISLPLALSLTFSLGKQLRSVGHSPSFLCKEILEEKEKINPLVFFLNLEQFKHHFCLQCNILVLVPVAVSLFYPIVSVRPSPLGGSSAILGLPSFSWVILCEPPWD